MPSIFIVLIASWLTFTFFYLRKDKFAIIVLALPVASISYFVISTSIFSFGQAVPFNFYSDSLQELYSYVLLSILLYFLAVILGLKLGKLIFPKRKRSKANFLKPLKLNLTRSLGTKYLVITLSPIVFVVMSVGFLWLYSRETFAPEEALYGWFRFADLSFLVSAILTPFLKSKYSRFISVSALVVIFSAVGSRSASVMIIIYVLITRYIIGEKKNRQIFYLLFAISLTSLLISLRQANQGGLVSIVSIIPNISTTEFFENLIFSINYFLNYSIVVNALLINLDPANFNDFVYSILPLPSFIYDRTAEYDAVMRFRKNIPFPGFGYALSLYGTTIFTSIVFVLSFVFSMARQFFVKKHDVYDNILLVSITILPFFFSLQYNLRTSSRIMYLFISLYFLFGIFRSIFHGIIDNRKKNPKKCK